MIPVIQFKHAAFAEYTEQGLSGTRSSRVPGTAQTGAEHSLVRIFDQPSGGA